MADWRKFVEAAKTKAAQKAGGQQLVVRNIELEADRLSRLATSVGGTKTTHQERYDIRAQLRAQAGFGTERIKRGGVAGVYDANKKLIQPVLQAAATAVLAPAALAAVPVLRSIAPSGAPSLSPTVPNMLVPTGAALNVRSAIGGLVGGAVATIGQNITNRIFGGGPASPPPIPQGFQIPQPLQGPVGRTISRILPGGKTGREFTAATDLTDRVGRPIAVHPMVRESVVGPSGYVMVNMNGERIAMLKSFAIRAGLYKSPPKPPVSGYDMRAITRAAAAGKRVKKLASKVGFSCVTKGRGRTSAAPRRKSCK